MGFRHGSGTEHMMSYGNYSFLSIMIIAVLLLIILFLAYKLIQKNRQLTTEDETSNEALNILKERYARGELSDEEFTHKKEVLFNNK